MRIKFIYFITIFIFFLTKPAFADEIELNPEIEENSPLWQRWKQEIPDVLEEIKKEPRFATRIRLGYAQYPSSDDAVGWLIGIEDLWVGKTPLSLTALYQDSATGDRTVLGSQVQYYLLPLGNYINIAPVLGYRYIQTGEYNTSGLNLGARLVLALSATGAADIFLTQSFIFSGDGQQVGITSISFGYAITPMIRLSTDFEQENSVAAKNNRIAILVEIFTQNK